MWLWRSTSNRRDRGVSKEQTLLIKEPWITQQFIGGRDGQALPNSTP